MRIIFLLYHGFSESSGISKKILCQIKALRELGHRVNVCTYDMNKNRHRVRMMDEEIIEDYGTGKWAAVRKRISYDGIYRYAVAQEVNMIYVRSFHNANPFTVRLFYRLQKAGIKIGIVTFSDEKTIFGQRTVRISNGVDFDTVPLRKTINNNSSPTLHLIGVAEVHYWHGYDRLIHGLGEYYRQYHDKEIYFHIVGGVWKSEMYHSQHAPGFHELITHYHIEKQVIFHGQRMGKELDELFDLADFAIGSLARHRSHIDKIKTLKNREYAARGIPFIYSETDEDFDRMPYILKAPADESAIDITKIIRFCSTLDIPPKQIRNSIYHLSWKNQMEKVIKEL